MPASTVAPKASQPARPATTTPADCTAGELRVSAERIDGAGGQQFATVVVTARAACRLGGVAVVTLTDAAGRALVTARAASAPSRAFELSAGSVVKALVHGPSTCNAVVSSYLTITASPASGRTRVALPLRACPLTVDSYQR